MVLVEERERDERVRFDRPAPRQPQPHATAPRKDDLLARLGQIGGLGQHERPQRPRQGPVGPHARDDLLAEVAPLRVAHRVLLEAELGQQRPFAPGRVRPHPGPARLDAQHLEHFRERARRQDLEPLSRRRLGQRGDAIVARRKEHEVAQIAAQRSPDHPPAVHPDARALGARGALRPTHLTAGRTEDAREGSARGGALQGDPGVVARDVGERDLLGEQVAVEVGAQVLDLFARQEQEERVLCDGVQREPVLQPPGPIDAGGQVALADRQPLDGVGDARVQPARRVRPAHRQRAGVRHPDPLAEDGRNARAARAAGPGDHVWVRHVPPRWRSSLRSRRCWWPWGC